MLSPAEAARIEVQIQDPFIQKYLRCLAVHVCTVPVTQVVMVLAGAAVAVYGLVYRQLSWAESMGYAAAAAAGDPADADLARIDRSRRLRASHGARAGPAQLLDRRSGLVLHVIGYLAFPLQMVTQNPALARFMAGRWARRIANVVPVFGESGALLEHAVFDLFFNLPISMARGLRERPLRWVTGMLAIAVVVAALAFGVFVGLREWR